MQIKKLGHSVPQCITVFHSVIRSPKTPELKPPVANSHWLLAASRWALPILNS